MTYLSLIRGCVRHTGYALLVLASVLVSAEALIPAFATPYVNPYRWLMIGIFLVIIGSWNEVGLRMGRWIAGLVLLLFVSIAICSQIPFHGGNRGLVLAVIVLGIAFFVASVYPKDL